MVAAAHAVTGGRSLHGDEEIACEKIIVEVTERRLHRQRQEVGMLIHPNPGALVWPAAMIVWGPGFTTASHRHHCVQLVMAMRGSLLIRRRCNDNG
jgi:hypothetical protein